MLGRPHMLRVMRLILYLSLLVNQIIYQFTILILLYNQLDFFLKFFKKRSLKRPINHLYVFIYSKISWKSFDAISSIFKFVLFFKILSSSSSILSPSRH